MIDASLVEVFQADGAVVVRGLLTDEWVETLRAAIPELLEGAYDPRTRLGQDVKGSTLTSDGMWHHCEPFARMLFNSPVGGAAAACMRSETARLYEDLLLYTDPEVAGAAWHRDAPHWPLAGSQLSSVWFSLEPVTGESGALRYVAGSHRDADELATSESLLAGEADVGERRVLVFDAEPGDAIVFHPRGLHAAYGAAPDRPRRSFTLRFTGDDVRFRPRRSMYHAWMFDCGLHKGDVLHHPWFPLVHG